MRNILRFEAVITAAATLENDTTSIRTECIIPIISGSLSWNVNPVCSPLSGLFIHYLCINLLLLFGTRYFLESFAALVRIDYRCIVHVRFVHSVICITSIKLPENMCSHSVKGLEITVFMFADHSFELVIYCYVFEH